MAYGKPLRGVIVYDIELDGGVSAAADFQKILSQYAESFMDYLKKENPSLAEVVKFTQAQAEVPLQERRGSTGPLDQIVFRGTRGNYERTETTKLMIEEVDTRQEMVIGWVVGERDKKLYWSFPLSKIAPRTREGILSRWALGQKGHAPILIVTETFQKYAQQV